mgnify:CR=1 FL=1
MWSKLLVITLLFFIIALLQFSFLPYFSIAGFSANLVFVLFFMLIYFSYPPVASEVRRHSNYEIFFLIITAGFFLGVYLPYGFGVSIITLFFVYCAKKLAIHFMGEFKEPNSIFYFLPIFVICFMVYNVIFHTFATYYNGFSLSSLRSQFELLPTIINILYHCVIISLVFYGYKKIRSLIYNDRQLKLL